MLMNVFQIIYFFEAFDVIVVGAAPVGNAAVQWMGLVQWSPVLKVGNERANMEGNRRKP
jgi:threonine dehydrogenase-like Zn-dependent dehydrogenase